MGNQWLFRFRPNDSYSGRVIADYGVNALGKKKWAVLHSSDAFGTAGGKALSGALEKLGCPAILDQPYANQSQDFTPVVLAIKQFRRRYSRIVLHLRKRSRHFSPASCASSVSTFPGSARPRSPTSRAEVAGPALYGTFASPTMPKTPAMPRRRSASSIAMPSRSRRITRVPGPTTPSRCSPRHQQGRSTDPAKIREADPRHQKFPGAEGEYNFDQNGDGLHGYNIVKNDKGNIHLRQAYRIHH